MRISKPIRLGRGRLILAIVGSLALPIVLGEPALAAAPTQAATATSSPASQQARIDEAALLAADTPPPVPTGFKTRQDVMQAVLTGRLTVLNPKMRIPVPDNVLELKDVEYGRVGDRPLLLDLYVPKGLTRPVPALIFIHGGGWQGGDRRDYKYYTVRYAKRGYVAATISYRFVKEAIFPACVQDAKCAVRWMRANAAKYHVDPKRIAALGGSAGGHLAMMLGYSAGVPELEGDGGHAGVSSAVQAVVNLYGPVDLTVPVAHEHPITMAFFGGKTYKEAPDQYKLASPITHLDKNDPPTLILQGTLDELVPVAQADMLAKRLKALGIPCMYDRLEGYPHTMDISREVNIRCQWFIHRFLEKRLGWRPAGERKGSS